MKCGRQSASHRGGVRCQGPPCESAPTAPLAPSRALRSLELQDGHLPPSEPGIPATKEIGDEDFELVPAAAWRRASHAVVPSPRPSHQTSREGPGERSARQCLAPDEARTRNLSGNPRRACLPATPTRCVELSTSSIFATRGPQKLSSAVKEPLREWLSTPASSSRIPNRTRGMRKGWRRRTRVGASNKSARDSGPLSIAAGQVPSTFKSKPHISGGWNSTEPSRARTVKELC